MAFRSIDVPSEVARVNGVALHAAGQTVNESELRQRACVELLRQRAQQIGLLAQDDVPGEDGSTSEAASSAVEALLEREVPVPSPSEEACRRYFAAHAARFRRGDRIHARHILFALTPGMEVAPLRARAEACLLDVRCEDGRGDDKFAGSAEHLSNCPSGAVGGDLGWLRREDCAPEFAAAIFGHAGAGVLPALVHTRFGLHVVEVLGRENGTEPDYESVRGAVEAALRQQAFATALRQYLMVLAGGAQVAGIRLEAVGTPLVQ